MKYRRWAAVLALSLALGACGGEDQEEEQQNVRASTVIAPETRVDAVPEEEPAVARAQWRAVNNEARTVTGNLRVSVEARRGGPLIFAFASGITVRAQPYQVVRADSRSGVGGRSFASVLDGDPRVNTHLYRVLEENVTRSAAQGGLCGQEPPRYLAVSEFVDGSGRWVFKLAAFRGEDAPPSSEDPLLCAAYSFTAQ